MIVINHLCFVLLSPILGAIIRANLGTRGKVNAAGKNKS